MTIPYSLIPIAALLGIYLSIIGLIATRMISRRGRKSLPTGVLPAPKFDPGRSWTANARFSFQLESEEGKIGGLG